MHARFDLRFNFHYTFFKVFDKIIQMFVLLSEKNIYVATLFLLLSLDDKQSREYARGSWS